VFLFIFFIFFYYKYLKRKLHQSRAGQSKINTKNENT
jgi:hypothetical protein